LRRSPLVALPGETSHCAWFVAIRRWKIRASAARRRASSGAARDVATSFTLRERRQKHRHSRFFRAIRHPRRFAMHRRDRRIYCVW
jgi:hypothetical protein